jgi:ABC-type uncharacterized transport system YnjBCD substrate-binding protein
MRRSQMRSVIRFTVTVLLVSVFTACTLSSPSPDAEESAPVAAIPSSTEEIAEQLQREGATLNLYWPAGGTIKTWITDTLVPGYEAYVEQEYGVAVTVNVLATGGGDESFIQRLAAYEQANTAGGNDFDIDVVRLVPSIDLIEAGEAGWLLPILPDYAEILPNLAKVNAPGLESFTTAGQTYAIAIYQPTISLFYNREQVPNPPQSIPELLDWAEANPRRFTYEDPRSSSGIGSGAMFMLTVMKTFGDPDDPATYEPGFEFLEQLQPYVYPQPTESAQMIELMKRGDIWLMAFWNDFGLSVARDQNITFMSNYFPEEGTPVRNTPLAIPRAAAHRMAALLFVDYTLSDEIQRELALLTQQIPATTSETVWQQLPEDTFGYDFDYIQSHTFAAFNSQDNLTGIKEMVDQFSQKVLEK